MFINKLLIFLIGLILGFFLGAIIYELALSEIVKPKTWELKILPKIPQKETVKYQIFYKWIHYIQIITRKINEWITNINKK
ncbi:hypothetical protein RS022_07790 [Candidatus Phytoplasma rubi]|uniref:Uncharacterized protein n=1 Tax=Candidatus Phytoplasma rubi TaxID=399025 RepID=A0ABY7BSL6_9MOLU|nr:hypothetical protein RS022_07790 [Candidatus Phytoplasma rubi]